MQPYVIAFADSSQKLAILTRYASSIEILIEKLSLSVGDELLAIRELEWDETSGFDSAGHCPTICGPIAVVAGDHFRQKQISRAFTLTIEDGETGKKTQIERFGQSLAQCLRIFSRRDGVPSQALFDYGAHARVIAIRELTENEIEALVAHSERPTFQGK